MMTRVKPRYHGIDRDWRLDDSEYSVPREENGAIIGYKQSVPHIPRVYGFKEIKIEGRAARRHTARTLDRRTRFLRQSAGRM